MGRDCGGGAGLCADVNLWRSERNAGFFAALMIVAESNVRIRIAAGVTGLGSFLLLQFQTNSASAVRMGEPV